VHQRTLAPAPITAPEIEAAPPSTLRHRSIFGSLRAQPLFSEAMNRLRLQLDLLVHFRSPVASRPRKSSACRRLRPSGLGTPQVDATCPQWRKREQAGEVHAL
jgi:hypothetical protein